MSPKLVIWALYDDGYMSYYNALKNDPQLEVHSVGIQEHPDLLNYHLIDLRLTNSNLINDLLLLPPHILF